MAANKCYVEGEGTGQRRMEQTGMKEGRRRGERAKEGGVGTGALVLGVSGARPVLSSGDTAQFDQTAANVGWRCCSKAPAKCVTG